MAQELLVMEKDKRLLIPIDFSPASEDALRFGLKLSVRERSEVIILHVVSPYEGGVESFAPVYDFGVYLDEKKQALEEYIRHFLSDNRIRKRSLRVLCDSGAPAQTILRNAASTGSQLIIMGSRGGGNISKILLGSTSQQVLAQSHIPLLLIPPGFGFEAFNDRVCFATDFHLRLNRASMHLFQQYDFLRKGLLEFVHVHEGKQEIEEEKHAALIELLFGELKTKRKYICAGEFELSVEAHVRNSLAGLLILLPHQRNFLYYLFFRGHTLPLVKHLAHPVLILYES